METFIVLGFCFILYEALDFFQSCYTNNNLHEQQHPQFSKDISSEQTDKSTVAGTATAAPIAQPSSSSAEFTLHATESDENVSTPFVASITTIPLSDTHIVGNSDLDLIAVSSSHLHCVDSEFGAGVGELDDSITGHGIDNSDDNSDENSDSDINTIQTNQSSSPYRSSCSSSGSSKLRSIYSICDRVNHFDHRSELLIDYHCSSTGSSNQNNNNH